MTTYGVLVCFFVLCFVSSGVVGDDDDDDFDHDDVIPAYGKLVGSGRKRVILPTIQNILTICADLFLDAAPEVPKQIKSDLKQLAYDLQKFDGDDEEYLIHEAKDIIRKIEKGYIDDDCDFTEDLKEALYVVIVIVKACESDIADRYDK